MSGAAGFEEHRCRLVLGEEALETGSRKSVTFFDVAGVVGDGQFEDGLGEIDGDGRMRHGGLLLHESDWFLETESGLAHYDADGAAGGVHSITAAARAASWGMSYT